MCGKDKIILKKSQNQKTRKKPFQAGTAFSN